MKIMVSACLLGEKCKYNGGDNRDEELIRLLSGHTVIPVCPEVLGGLPAPRVPAEIVNGKVMNREGVCVDDAFRRGAAEALALAKREQPDWIILQSRSPSCGVKQIYDGTFSGTLKRGSGIFAKMATEAGFQVTDVEDAAGALRERSEPSPSLPRLRKLSGEFTVCKVKKTGDLPLDAEFCFVGKTDEEISLVCRTEDAPEDTPEREDGWKGFRVEGMLDFSLVGILSKLTGVLAENRIGIFAVSTFNTDYILVKAENYDRAAEALKAAGYEVM